METIVDPSSETSTQWNVFCSQHCRMWFGRVREFDSKGTQMDMFRVMHAFKPRQNDNLTATEIEHSNVYYYDDQRGTVSSSPRCGPWFYKQEDSNDNFKGVKHPKWPHTKYIFFPNGSGILFNNSAVNYGQVETCIKLFVHHPTRPSIRLSVMLEYCDFVLESFKIYMENSDGWKSEFWDNQQIDDRSKATNSDLSCSSSNLQSSQTIDLNLNLSSSNGAKSVMSQDKNNFFGTGSDNDCQDISALFDFVHPGYLIFYPTQNITLTCPRFMDHKFDNVQNSPCIDASSPLSLSPISKNPQSSFVALRWNLCPDNLSTDLVAEFDYDNRFNNLSQYVYCHSPAKEP